MNKTDWATKIAESRERALRLQARLANGQNEADAAHEEGFLTRHDVNRHVAQTRTALHG